MSRSTSAMWRRANAFLAMCLDCRHCLVRRFHFRGRGFGSVLCRSCTSSAVALRRGVIAPGTLRSWFQTLMRWRRDCARLALSFGVSRRDRMGRGRSSRQIPMGTWLNFATTCRDGLTRRCAAFTYAQRVWSAFQSDTQRLSRRGAATPIFNENAPIDSAHTAVRLSHLKCVCRRFSARARCETW